jgi:pilus assembly protein CpaB
MERTATLRRRRQLNPRQRQGLLLVVIAAAGLVGVFVLIANYVSSVSKQVGPKINVLVLNASVPAYQPLSASNLTETSVPQKWAPQRALSDPAQAAGLVAGISLPAGTVLEQGMLVAPPALQPGRREIAILVDAETGVAGQVTPGSIVDVIATFAGNNQGSKPSSRVVVASTRVLTVGTPTTAGGSASASSQGISQDQVVPVTFSLTPQQVLEVSYAESFAQKVRLSLVAPGTNAPPAQLPPYQLTQ